MGGAWCYSMTLYWNFNETPLSTAYTHTHAHTPAHVPIHTNVGSWIFSRGDEKTRSKYLRSDSGSSGSHSKWDGAPGRPRREPENSTWNGPPNNQGKNFKHDLWTLSKTPLGYFQVNDILKALQALERVVDGRHPTGGELAGCIMTEIHYCHTMSIGDRQYTRYVGSQSKTEASSWITCQVSAGETWPRPGRYIQL